MIRRILHVIEKLFNGWHCEEYEYIEGAWVCPICGYVNGEMSYNTWEYIKAKEKANNNNIGENP